MNYLSQKVVFIIAIMLRIIKYPFFVIKNFFKRIDECCDAMGKVDKVIAFIFFLAALSMLGIKAENFYKNSTRLVPNFGGRYSEEIVGEFKYLNPVLATSDVDTSLSRLIFSPLVAIDRDGSTIPVVAKSWEISPDKLLYTFTLRDDVYFHDGEKLTSKDVIYTVDQIKDPDFESPFYEAWKDVETKAEGDDKVSFSLPRVYGPFIYNCDFGILPAHISPDDLSKKFIGSGPYKYEGVKKSNQKVTRLNLISNQNYFNGRPYINNFEFSFFDKKEEAFNLFQKGKSSALSGVLTTVNKEKNDLSFDTAKKLALIPNLRIDKFKDREFRKKVLGDFSFTEKTKIALTTLDSPMQKSKAEELKTEYAKRNIELELRFMNPTQMKQVLDEKKYELLLYGFDFSHDPDLYVFWHTSQMDKMNFAGYSDKKSDLFLEDARMTTDERARKEKYAQFFNTISDESLALFFDPVKFNFYAQKKIKYVSQSKFSEVSFRYFDIEKWFIKEKRVKR